MASPCADTGSIRQRVVHARVDRRRRVPRPTRRPCCTAAANAAPTPSDRGPARWSKLVGRHRRRSRSGTGDQQPSVADLQPQPARAIHRSSAPAARGRTTCCRSRTTRPRHVRWGDASADRIVELASRNHVPAVGATSRITMCAGLDGIGDSCSGAPTFVGRLFDPDEAAIGVQAMVVRAGGTLYTDIFDRKPPLPPLAYAASFALTDSTDIRLMRVLVTLCLAAAGILVALDAHRRRRGRRARLVGRRAADHRRDGAVAGRRRRGQLRPLRPAAGHRGGRLVAPRNAVGRGRRRRRHRRRHPQPAELAARRRAGVPQHRPRTVAGATWCRRAWPPRSPSPRRACTPLSAASGSGT